MSDAASAKLSAIAKQRWGLFTTAAAAEAGVSRNQLARMTKLGALERVAQGVYRFAGAPEPVEQELYATWLALGGANYAPHQVPPVVAAGQTAALLHEIGDFYPGRYDFIVPTRKGTRLPGVRLRVRQLSAGEFTFVDQMPTLTVERVIADLVSQWTDLSLVADMTRDALTAGKLVSPQKLSNYLSPLAKSHGYARNDGGSFASAIFELAGARPTGAYQ